MKTFGVFRLDVVNQCLWREDARVSLMPKPFAVLRYLVEHPGRLVTHDQLLGAVWPDTYVQPEILRRYILEIRRALGDSAASPQFVQTFPKRGYQFIASVQDDQGVAERASIVPTMPVVSARLVGRGSALADLERCLLVALTGRRQIVFVVGEPGIGKTSLTDAFRAAGAAMADVTVIRGQSVEGFGGKEPYYPLLEAIGQLARGPSKAFVVATLLANAPTWLIQFPALIRPEQQAALQREILGATRERMVRELCEALEIITASIPLVLILEDLHWVDHSTMDVISALARRREPSRLLVVGTLRPADLILTESPLKTLKHDLVLHHLSHEIELERLSESDVQAYLGAAFGPGDLPSALASVIYRHSDGNPLFMTAMLDHLAKQGVLVEAGGRWRIAIPIDQVDPGVPETLKQMLEMQLQHATDAEQQLLKCASVAGQRFTSWAVGTMLAQDPAAVEVTCEELVERQQFLKGAGSRELSNGVATTEYQFGHALYREILYRRLNATQRITFHRRLAEGFEALRLPIVPEMASEIALHFEEGQDYDRAVQYLMPAAHNATRRYAHHESVTVLEHAWDLLPRLAPDRARILEFQLLEQIGGAYYASGDTNRSAAAYVTLATRAAESGQLAERADALLRLSHPAESIPFFVKALEIDPDFVSAYTGLSRIYSNLGEIERAKEYAKLAYERRDQASDRDRLSITYQYHYEVTGNQALASQTLEAWKRAFPLEFQPVNSLVVMHNFLGCFERAIEEGHEAVERNPSHGYPYSNLAHAYRGVGRFDAARDTAARAVALEIETLPTRRLLYQLALLAGDERAAAQQVHWAKDKPREFDFVGARAQALGWSGKVRDARALYEHAAAMAEERGFVDVSMSHLAWSTSMELMYGYTGAAMRIARRVLARNASYDPQLRVAAVLGLTGAGTEAEAIAVRLSEANPEHTLINSVLVPIVRASVELGRHRPLQAIECLRAAIPYELGFVAALAPLYLRGLAYLRLGAAPAAVQAFERLIERRGSDPFSPYHALAPLGLARAHQLAGNPRESRQWYERFLAGWRDADADVPVLLEAREERDCIGARERTSSGRNA